MIELSSRHLFTLSITLHPTIELGTTPAGGRRIFPVAGGGFEGERLAGEVLPLGAPTICWPAPTGRSSRTCGCCCARRMAT